MTKQKLPLAERLQKYISYCPTTGCWLWTGATIRQGYGLIWVGGRLLYAHRVSWELANGPIQDGMELDHKCHCRSCVNPDHLRLATNAENHHNQIRSKNNTSGFKGVSWDRKAQKWRAQIKMEGKKRYLGYYSTPEEAHAAYCEEAKRLHGEFANFG